MLADHRAVSKVYHNNRVVISNNSQGIRSNKVTPSSRAIHNKIILLNNRVTRNNLLILNNRVTRSRKTILSKVTHNNKTIHHRAIRNRINLQSAIANRGL